MLSISFDVAKILLNFYPANFQLEFCTINFFNEYFFFYFLDLFGFKGMLADFTILKRTIIRCAPMLFVHLSSVKVFLFVSRREGRICLPSPLYIVVHPSLRKSDSLQVLLLRYSL